MRTWIAGLLVAFASLDAAAAVTSTVVDIAVSGGTQRFLYVRPDAPIAIVVVISGGDGTLGIQNDGSMATRTALCGPVTRNRQQMADAGFTGASAATFTYTLDGVTQSQAITRQVFATPTACP